MNKKGEPRHGGKPLGWKKPEGIRRQCSTRAYPDEWTLILKFARMVKKGDRSLCEQFIEQNYHD